MESFSGRGASCRTDEAQELEEFVGQDHLLGPGKVLRQAIESDQLPSMILWGPPGSGKTTLAMVIASTTGAQFIAFSAVLSGVKEIKEVIGEAGEEWRVQEEEDHPLCGRNPSFQQGPAGCLSSPRGKGDDHSHWCDDRKPVL